MVRVAGIVCLMLVFAGFIFADDLMQLKDQGGATKFTVDVNGNVGIGTPLPGYKLEVNGALGISSGSGVTYDGSLSHSMGSPYAITTLKSRGGTGTWQGAINFDLSFNAGTDYTAMTIRDNGGSGNVGIGSTSPLTRLHAEGSQISSFTGSTRGILTLSAPYNVGYYTPIDFLFNTNAVPTARIAAYHDAGGSRLVFGTSNNYGTGITNTAMTINQYGYVGIGQSIPQYPIHMGGDAYCTGSVWADASSREHKENIDDLAEKDALDALLQLKPKRFNYKNDTEEVCLGFIAEEVPELVAMKDRKGLSPMDFVALLTKVVQSQQEELNKTRKESDDMKKKNDEVVSRCKAMEEKLTEESKKKEEFEARLKAIEEKLAK